MTGSGKSQEEATAMIMGAISAKITTLIGFWNVKTMYEQGKMAQVIDEIKRYRLDIFGVSEGRWTRSGRMKTGTGETIQGTQGKKMICIMRVSRSFEERDGELLDGVEINKQQDHPSTFEGQADQRVHYTVLRTYQYQL